MQPICDLLPKTVKKSDITRHVRTAMVLRVAVEALGEALRAPEGLQARSFRDGILTVSCLRPALVANIVSRHDELVVAVNVRLGVPEVRKIRALS